MSDTNPYKSPAYERAIATESQCGQPESFGGAMVQGVRLGVKWMTLIMGPFAALGLLAAVGITIYRFVWGEGLAILVDPELRWETLKNLGSPFGFYFVCCIWGIVAGELVCPITYLVRRANNKRNEH